MLFPKLATVLIASYCLLPSYLAGQQTAGASTLDTSDVKSDDAIPFLTAKVAANEPWVTVSGRVVDSKGEAVSNATVQCRNYWTVSETTSEIDGKYEIKIPLSWTSSSFFCIASSRDGSQIGFQKLRTEASWTHRQNGIKDLEIEVKPKVPVTTKVLDFNGLPVADAYVAFENGWGCIFAAKTDSGGVAKLDLPKDFEIRLGVAFSSDIGVDYYCYAPTKISALPSRATRKFESKEMVVFNLLEPAPFDVSIVDPEDKPIPEIVVRPWMIKKSDEPESAQLSKFSQLGIVNEITDKNGKASFNWLPKETVEVIQWSGSNESFLIDFATWKPKPDEAVERRVKMVGWQKVLVSGQVLFEDVEPQRVQIRLHGEQSRVGLSTSVSPVADIYTDEDGKFSTYLLPNSAYAAMVNNKELALAEESIFALGDLAPSNPIHFTVRPATRLFGKVTYGEQKTPVPDLNVIFIRQEQLQIPRVGGPGTYLASPGFSSYSKTNADGEFEFLVGTGKYLVVGPSNASKQTIVIADEPSVRVDFHTELPEMGRLKILVVDSDSKAIVANASATGYYESSAWVSMPRDKFVTDENGRFELERARHPIVFQVFNEDKSKAAIVKVPASRTFYPIAVRQLGNVRGRLMDPETLLPYANVEVRYGYRIYGDPPENRSWMVAFGGTVKTNDQGVFSIERVVPGVKYNLSLVVSRENNRPSGWLPITEFFIDKSERFLEMGDVEFSRRNRGPN